MVLYVGREDGMTNMHRGPVTHLLMDGSNQTALLQVNWQRIGAEKSGGEFE